MSAYRMLAPGPFTADQIREGDHYELSNGHAILCMPTGRRGGRSNLTGGSVLETDPAVKSAGVDIGYSDNPGHLRAPDVSVGDFADAPGWAPTAPPLAVEYADRGQDEADLQQKIRELFDGGTKIVWVVRLVGRRRVEVHTSGKAMRLAHSGEELKAPGILQNPVLVDALFDRDAAHEATLRNLLQRKGYASIEAVRDEGKREGKLEGKLEGQREGKLEGKLEALYQVLSVRGLEVSAEQRATMAAVKDTAQVDAWFGKAIVAASASEIFASEPAAKKPRTRRARG